MVVPSLKVLLIITELPALTGTSRINPSIVERIIVLEKEALFFVIPSLIISRTFNIIDLLKNLWSADNPNTDIAKFYYADQLAKKNFTRSANAGTTYNNNGSRFYEKGDYCALRDLTLSYMLPSKWTKRAMMDEVSVYVTGQNLCYMTKYTGSNPEPPLNSTIGIDYGRYPITRTFLFGLSVTF